ncbi:unnamed protein product, partial [Oppiella nova]
DHEMNVRTVMSDLMLTDIMDTKAESCSGGELKRLAIAVELTALHKPNLILCDEPTTGLDSNIAEVVMNCLKSLVQKHDICLIASIHQPNSEIIELCDKLYVLSKGGHCMYWGSPEFLAYYLRKFQIDCTEDQVPIESLIKIGSKGITDPKVIELRNEANVQAKHSRSCLEVVDKDFYVEQNFYYMYFTFWTFSLLQVVFSIVEKVTRLSIFTIEHHNNWYSSGVYYLTETIIDLLSVTINACISATILYKLCNEPAQFKRYFIYLVAFNLNLHCMDAFGHLVAIVWYEMKYLCVMVGLLYATLNAMLSNIFIETNDMAKKTLFSSEKVILSGIQGFIELGSFNALMGPSGAGKTSLLRSLNGLNRNLMTKDSQIWLSRNVRIRTCFIGQDQREHLISGLTVKQSITYASKLKNGSNSDVDHEMNVRELMEELAISDISVVNVEKCSSGQQKRIVMAQELSPRVKPNLICVDEPTSGVDSYSALLMIQCFKRLSRRHGLSIIASIHQPNLEIVMSFDLLYILAKGGQTVYSGRPRDLKQHLTDCHIICTENQIPIEVIIKLCANGLRDEAVIELSAKTNEDMNNTYHKRVNNELILQSNGIPIETKSFSFAEFWYLLLRGLAYTLGHNWKFIAVHTICYTGLGFFIIFLFSYQLDRPSSCQPLASNYCNQNAGALEEYKILGKHLVYINIYAFIIMVVQIIYTSLTISNEIPVFYKEHRNYWYSTESYFLVTTILDFVPSMVSIVIYCLIINVYEMEGTYAVLLYCLSISALSYQSIGHILGICFGERAVIMSVLLLPIFLCLGGFFIPSTEFGHPVIELSHVVPMRYTIEVILIFFYGFDRCPEGQVSSIMHKFLYTDDMYDMSRNILVYQLVCYRILSSVGTGISIYTFGKARETADIQLRPKYTQFHNN